MSISAQRLYDVWKKDTLEDTRLMTEWLKGEDPIFPNDTPKDAINQRIKGTKGTV